MEQKQLYGCVLRRKDNAFTEPDGLCWALKRRERERDGEGDLFFWSVE